MGRNHEVTTAHPLLGSSGELTEPGWSRTLLQRYDRAMIKAPTWRIKEWDYYLVLADKFAGAFTISDDGYIGLLSVSLLVFGKMSGIAILDDGTKIKVQDMMCFAEKVHNKY